MSTDTLGQILVGLILSALAAGASALLRQASYSIPDTFDCNRPVPSGFALEVERGVAEII